MSGTLISKNIKHRQYTPTCKIIRPSVHRQLTNLGKSSDIAMLWAFCCHDWWRQFLWWKVFVLMGLIFPIMPTSPPVHRAQGLTEWLDENKNDINRMLQFSHSPDLNPAKHLREIRERRVRPHHHQNISMREYPWYLSDFFLHFRRTLSFQIFSFLFQFLTCLYFYPSCLKGVRWEKQRTRRGSV